MISCVHAILTKAFCADFDFFVGQRAYWRRFYFELSVDTDVYYGRFHATCGLWFVQFFASSVPGLSSPLVLTALVLTALAAVFCLQYFAGFAFPLFAPAMFGAIGYGKGFTVLAGVSIALGCPAYAYASVITLVVDSLYVYVGRPWIVWKYGK